MTKDVKQDLIIFKWTPKSKYRCPECNKKKVNSDGSCTSCGKEFQLKMDMKS